MNDFMSYYNNQIANLRQSYNAEMQKLQNEAKQYSESLRQQMQNPFQQPTTTPVIPKQEVAPIVANAQSDQNNSVPINVQILAVLGDIKGRLDKAFPDKEKVENIIAKADVTNNISTPELPLAIPTEVTTTKTAIKEEVKQISK